MVSFSRGSTVLNKREYYREVTKWHCIYVIQYLHTVSNVPKIDLCNRVYSHLSHCAGRSS